MTPLEQLYRALKPIKISELAKTHVLYNQFYKKEFTGLQKMEQIRKLSGTTNTTRAIRDYKLTISDKAALQEASINDLVRSLMAKYSCKNNIDPFTLETIKALQHQKHPLITLNQWCFKLDSLLTYVQTTMKENRVPRNPFDRKQFLETGDATVPARAKLEPKGTLPRPDHSDQSMSTPLRTDIWYSCC